LIKPGSGVDLPTPALQVREEHSHVPTSPWPKVLEALCEQLKRLGRASVLDLHENAQFEHLRMIGVQPQQLIEVRSGSTAVAVQPTQVRHQQSQSQGSRFLLQEWVQHLLRLLKSAQGQKSLQKLALTLVIELLIPELLHQIADLPVHHQTAAAGCCLRSE
tara:strand:+ start:11806 stop:12288 length:483 start_codon:yes stop_codon:yes gene_type:complete